MDANQAIDQTRLFGPFVRAFHEVAPPTPEEGHLRQLRALAGRAVGDAGGLPGGPVHLNVPFAKPLEPTPVAGDVPGGLAEDHPLAVGGREEGVPYTRVTPRAPVSDPSELDALASLIKDTVEGVIVAGPLPEPEKDGAALRRLAAATGFPLLADPLSGGRHGERIGAAVVSAYDLFLRAPEARAALRPALVLRLGQSPTSAALNRWLEEHAGVRQVVIDPGHRWKDHQATASDYLRAAPGPTAASLAERLEPGDPAPSRWTERWLTLDGVAGTVGASDAAGPHEGTVMARVVEAVPEGWPLFVSSSMPVRDVDAFGRARAGALPIYGNRGASGIDGIVSTALGVGAGAGRPVVAVLGDLAFIHDMNGLLATREGDVDALFVVVQNDGGGIFHMLPVRDEEPHFTPLFATPHGLDFRHAAALHGLAHEVVEVGDVERLPAVLAEALEKVGAGAGSRMVEVRSDRDENEARHRTVEAAVRRAVLDRLETRRDPEEGDPAT